MRIFTAAPGRLADLEGIVGSTGKQLFPKYGIDNLFDGSVLEGAAIDGADAPNMLVCISSFKPGTSAEASWTSLEHDAAWSAALQAAEKSGPLLAKPETSLLLNVVPISPPPTGMHALAAGPSSRVFELRKYNTGTARLQNTVDEFNEGLAAILVKTGMTPVIYWVASDHTSFVYLLAHNDRAAAKASWAAFLPDFRPFIADFNTRHGITAGGPSTTQTATTVGSTPAAPPKRIPDDNRFLVPLAFSPLR